MKIERVRVMSGYPASRLTDVCTGHGCWPSRPIIESSTDFIIAGLGAARQSDTLAVHCCDSNCHSGVISSGSQTFIVNGKQQARISDPVSCGSTLKTGELTYIVG